VWSARPECGLGVRRFGRGHLLVRQMDSGWHHLAERCRMAAQPVRRRRICEPVDVAHAVSAGDVNSRLGTEPADEPVTAGVALFDELNRGLVAAGLDRAGPYRTARELDLNVPAEVDHRFEQRPDR